MILKSCPKASAKKSAARWAGFKALLTAAFQKALSMKPYLDKAPKVVQLVRLAYEKAGLTPIEEPIRGGTDGARLSSLGLPCPNVFTGGMNFHGIYECIPVKSLEKAADVAVKIAEVSATVKSLA